MSNYSICNNFLIILTLIQFLIMIKLEKSLKIHRKTLKMMNSISADRGGLPKFKRQGFLAGTVIC